MLKIEDVINRVNNDWLFPPDFLPTQTALTSGINNTTSTIPYNSTIITSEELELVGGGTLIQINREAMIVDSIDTTANEITVSTRGANNTVAAAHSSGDQILIAPPFYRKTIFDVVADTIAGYYPNLYAIRRSQQLQHVDGHIVEIPADAHIPHQLYMKEGNNWRSLAYTHFPNFPGVQSFNAVSTIETASSAELYLVYHGPFGRPEDEDTTLQSLGFQDHWVKLLTVSSVLHLVGSRDIDTISQTHIAQVLQAEFQNASQVSIRNDMLRYENVLLQRARSTLETQSHTPMEFYPGF